MLFREYHLNFISLHLFLSYFLVHNILLFITFQSVDFYASFCHRRDEKR
jgi:hypothetical protein